MGTKAPPPAAPAPAAEAAKVFISYSRKDAGFADDLVAGLIAVVMAPRAEAVHPGLGPWKYVAGLAFAVVLYLSVLLHEASHAYMARHYGFPVSSITLHFLGAQPDTRVAVFGFGLHWEALTALLGPAAVLADPLTVLFLVAGVNAINLSDLKPDAFARTQGHVMAEGEYNTLARSFPTNITAMVFGYTVKPGFTVADEAAISAPPKVDFNKP